LNNPCHKGNPLSTDLNYPKISGNLSGALKNVEMPSLWLSGRRDRIVHPDAMQQAAELSGGQFHLLRGGHAPFLQHAEDMSQIIRDFI